jgi:hypothetical protein
MVTAISNQLGRYRRDHREGQRTLLGHIFLLAWFFVIFVSVYDGYLVLENRVFLDELNPIGRLLISLNGGGVWLLLAAKFVGTVIVASMAASDIRQRCVLRNGHHSIHCSPATVSAALFVVRITRPTFRRSNICRNRVVPQTISDLPSVLLVCRNDPSRITRHTVDP